MLEFDIVSVHWNLKTIFYLNHVFGQFLVKEINKELKRKKIVSGDFKTLIFNISCEEGLSSDFVFGKPFKSSKDESKTVSVYFTEKHLLEVDEYTFHDKKFDFIYKTNAYRTYDLKTYVHLTLSALKTILDETNLDFSSLEKRLYRRIDLYPMEFNFKTEELMYLEDLNKKPKEWFSSPEGKEFCQQEHGKKWMKLLEKYSFDESGNAIFGEHKF